jgi:hypothetical protein
MQRALPLAADGGPSRAVSVSRRVWDLLPEAPVCGTILGAFDRACILLLSEGSVVVLVLPEVGDGPLNVVMADGSGALTHLQPGLQVRLEARWLHVGGLQVSLSRATVWEPRPNWERLRSGLDSTKTLLSLVRTFGLRSASGDSLLAMRGGGEGSPVPGQSALCSVVQAAAESLRAGWAGNEDSLRAAAAQLAGLGRGLTPAGDDFLLGVMLRAWLSHPMPRRFCQMLSEAAIPRTTALSAALLRAAAAGECAAPWHDLLGVLVRGSETELEKAVGNVLSYGHSSGADALAGFLEMGW